MGLLNIFVTVLIKFVTNVIMSIASEKMLEFMFFKLAEKLASKTATTVDDEWVKALRESYTQYKK